MSGGGWAQDVIAFEPRAVQRGEMIERLMRKILGPQMILSSSHGSLVTEGGGLQEIHQDQVSSQAGLLHRVPSVYKLMM